MFRKILSHLSRSSLLPSSSRLLTFKFKSSFSSSPPPPPPPPSSSNPSSSSSSSSSTSSSSPTPFSKDLYIKQLTSDREELEKERSEGIDSAVQYSKRKSREVEVLTSSIDFAQISLQNLSLFPSEFKHPDELRYYVGSVKFRLTEENLLKCINGYIKFAPQLAQGLFDLENSNNEPSEPQNKHLEKGKEVNENKNKIRNENINQNYMKESTDSQEGGISNGTNNGTSNGTSQKANAKDFDISETHINDIKLSTPLSTSDLSSFSSFLLLLRSHFPSTSSSSLLLSAAVFGDLYCVREKEGFWEGLERKVLFMREKLKIEDFLSIFGCFSRQKEGSEYFYERSEETIENGWGTLGIEGLVGIMKSFYRVRLGTTTFVVRLLGKVEERLGEAGKTCLIDFLEVYVHSSYLKEKVMKLVEERLLEMLEELSVVDIGRITTAFGTYRGSASLFTVFEKKIISHLSSESTKIQTETQTLTSNEDPLGSKPAKTQTETQKMASKEDPLISLEELKLLMSGFLYTSRGSKVFFETIKPCLLHYLEELNTIEHSKLFKVVSMVGSQKERALLGYLEKKIVGRLKEVKEIRVEEITEVVKNTCLSRQGSREMFKLMELVVGYKMEEICKNPEAGRQIHRSYELSGLCSNELMVKLERKLVE